jgi:hypothetical protein
MISIEKLCEILNDKFIQSMLPEGLLTAELSDEDDDDIPEYGKSLYLNIAGLDIHIDENGDILGTGVMLPADFDISKFDDE